jgi:hypothetical protein
MPTSDPADSVYDFGPDRTLACGCQVINGAICFVSRCADLATKNLYQRPGRVIMIDSRHEDPRR